MERIDIQYAGPAELEHAAKRAAEVLAHGGVIIYPTDTVYGLGADATNEQAVAKVCAVKGREPSRSMLVMVDSLDAIEHYGVMTPLARRLANTFLPGQLSLLIGAKEQGLAPQTVGRLGAAFRIPDHAFCATITVQSNYPVVTTSANVSGLPQSETLDEMIESFGPNKRYIDLVFDAGRLPLSPPSTLVDARGEYALILREGAVPREDLALFLADKSST